MVTMGCSDDCDIMVDVMGGLEEMVGKLGEEEDNGVSDRSEVPQCEQFTAILVHSLEEEEQKNRSLSEYYFAVKGFGVLLPKNECQLGRGRRTGTVPPDIQGHLQAMLHLLCPGDTLHMAVRLESQHLGRVRYLAVVGRVGRQDKEEDCLLGIDFSGEKPSIGLVSP
ncbi:phosphatase Slingshot 2-like, partial [Homarus americanus]